MSAKLMTSQDQARVGDPVRVYGMAAVGTVAEIKGHGTSYVVARGEHRFLVPGSAVSGAVDGCERGHEIICAAPRAPPCGDDMLCRHAMMGGNDVKA